MEKFKIERDNEPTLKFSGELLAEANDRSYQGPKQNRFYSLQLYLTVAGKYVAVRHYTTRWQGESNSQTAQVCETIEDVIEFFGQGDLAKEIYSEARIANVEDLDAEAVA